MWKIAACGKHVLWAVVGLVMTVDTLPAEDGVAPAVFKELYVKVCMSVQSVKPFCVCNADFHLASLPPIEIDIFHYILTDPAKAAPAMRRATGSDRKKALELKRRLTDTAVRADTECTAKHLTPAGISIKPGQQFQDCDRCPKMTVLPAGSFMMGSDRMTHEGPQHKVTIAQPFAVGMFEVTFAEWDACVTDGGCNHKPDDLGWGRGLRPVINLSWDDAKEYVAWLSQKTGKTYRLPSEAEWEYAARAGTTTQFHFGNDEKQICRYANGADASYDFGHKFCTDGVGKMTAEVGQYVGNNFGLSDVHGNVWEWVEDCYSKTYEGAPSDGAPRTSVSCENHPTRGGSFAFNALGGLRITDRLKWSAPWRAKQIGFRVARTL